MFSLQTDEQLKLRRFILPLLVASDEYLSGVWGFMAVTGPLGLHSGGECRRAGGVEICGVLLHTRPTPCLLDDSFMCHLASINTVSSRPIGTRELLIALISHMSWVYDQKKPADFVGVPLKSKQRHGAKHDNDNKDDYLC